MKPGSPPKRRAQRTPSAAPAATAPLVRAEPDADPAFGAICALLAAGSRVLAVSDASTGLTDALSAAGMRVASAAPVDLAASDPSELFPGTRFDAVVVSGVLERIAAPWRLLEAARGALDRNGVVIALLLNAGNDAVRLAASLAAAAPEPAGDGSDRLRFFTRSGIEALFEESGLRVSGFERITFPGDVAAELVAGIFEPSDAPGADAGEDDPDAQTLQFVVRATPLAGAWDAAALRRRLHAVEARREEQSAALRARDRELRTLSSTVDVALDARARAEAAAADAVTRAADLAAERDAATRNNDALAAQVDGLQRDVERARAEAERERLKGAEAAAASELALDRANQAEARARNQVAAVTTTAAAARAHAEELAREGSELRAMLLAVEADRDRADARADAGAQLLSDLQMRVDELEQDLGEAGLQSVRLEELAAVNDRERARSIELESMLAQQAVTLAGYEERLRSADDALARRDRDLRRILTEKDAKHAQDEQRLAVLQAANAGLTTRLRQAQAEAAALATRMVGIATAIGADAGVPLERAVETLQRDMARLEAQFDVAQDQLAELLDRSRKDALVRIALEHELAWSERAATV